MQVAHSSHVIDMLDESALRRGHDGELRRVHGLSRARQRPGTPVALADFWSAVSAQNCMRNRRPYDVWNGALETRKPRAFFDAAARRVQWSAFVAASSAESRKTRASAGPGLLSLMAFTVRSRSSAPTWQRAATYVGVLLCYLGR